jgi:hypothetical protein
MHSPDGYVVELAPLRQQAGISVNSDGKNLPRVSSLGGSICPTNILRLVVSVVVYSIKTCPQKGAFPNVTKKGRESFPLF